MSGEVPAPSTLARQIEVSLQALHAPHTPPTAHQFISASLTHIHSSALIYPTLSQLLHSAAATPVSLHYACSTLETCTRRDYAHLPIGGRSEITEILGEFLRDERVGSVGYVVEGVLGAIGFVIGVELREGRDANTILDKIGGGSWNNLGGGLICGVWRRVGMEVKGMTGGDYERRRDWLRRKGEGVLWMIREVLRTGRGDIAERERREAVRCLKEWVGLVDREVVIALVEELELVREVGLSEDVSDALCEYMSMTVGAGVVRRMCAILHSVWDDVGQSSIREEVAQLLHVISEIAVVTAEGNAEDLCQNVNARQADAEGALMLLNAFLLKCIQCNNSLSLRAGMAGWEAVLGAADYSKSSGKLVIEVLPIVIEAIIGAVRFPSADILSSMEKADLFLGSFGGNEVLDLRMAANDLLLNVACAIGLESYLGLLEPSLQNQNSKETLPIAEAAVFAISSACDTAVTPASAPFLTRTLKQLIQLAHPRNMAYVRFSTLVCLANYAIPISCHLQPDVTLTVLDVVCKNLVDASTCNAACEVMSSILSAKPENAVSCLPQLVATFNEFLDILDSGPAASLASALVDVASLAEDQSDRYESIESIIRLSSARLLAVDQQGIVVIAKDICVLERAVRSMKDCGLIVKLFQSLFPTLRWLVQRYASDEVISTNVCRFIEACVTSMSLRALDSSRAKEDVQIGIDAAVASVELCADAADGARESDCACWLRCLGNIVPCVWQTYETESAGKDLVISTGESMASGSPEQENALLRSFLSTMRPIHDCKARGESYESCPSYLEAYFSLVTKMISRKCGPPGITTASKFVKEIGIIGFTGLSSSGKVGRVCLKWWKSFFVFALQDAAVNAMVEGVLGGQSGFEKAVGVMLQAAGALGGGLRWAYMVADVLLAMAQWAINSGYASGGLEDVIGMWIGRAFQLDGVPAEGMSKEDKEKLRRALSKSVASRGGSGCERNRQAVYRRRFRQAVGDMARICRAEMSTDALLTYELH